MRLLLDEHLSPIVAASLRRRGHDVVAVAEHVELRGQADIDVLMAASADRCAVVTEDVRDFRTIAARRLASRGPHWGVVLVAQRAFPRSSEGFGRLIRALDALLAAHPGDDELLGDVIWLEPDPGDTA